jgi:hypothetical protein
MFPRSASYSYRRQECRLSSEDRFTQPQAFETSLDSDYLENQCIPRKLFLLYIVSLKFLSKPSATI